VSVRGLLTTLMRQVSDIRGSGGSALDRLNQWRDWSAQALPLGRLHLTRDSLQEVVLGGRFMLLQTLAPADYGPMLSSLIDTELQVRLDQLGEAIQELDQIRDSWKPGRLAVILDTNVLLAAGPRVTKIKWDAVLGRSISHAAFAIPIQVVEELDRLKDRGSNGVRGDAAHALRWIDDLSLSGDLPVAFETGAPNTTIRVWVDENERVPLAEVDRDIIDRAQQLRPIVNDVVIASMDRSMVLRAKSYDLMAVLLTEGNIPARINASGIR
jgi:rRNA-processing protein FCF1